MAQFVDGASGDEGGVRWRVRKGRKVARDGEDLVFEIATDGWVPVKMSLVAAALVMLYENEDRLYPPRMGFAGRAYLAAYLKKCLSGWETATRELEAERAAAAERRAA